MRIGTVRECESGSMYNKNTKECDATCTVDHCCAHPDRYEYPETTTTTSTTTTTTTEAPTVVDCFVDNGGCSHYCNFVSQQCECPSCWVLSDDGMTCDIDSTKIQVSCSDTGFYIEVDECIFIGDSADTVTIGLLGHGDGTDEWCQSSNYTDGVHSIASGLDSCGTEVSYESDGRLSFANTLEVTAREFSNGLIFDTEVSIPGTGFQKFLEIFATYGNLLKISNGKSAVHLKPNIIPIQLHLVLIKKMSYPMKLKLFLMLRLVSLSI